MTTTITTPDEHIDAYFAAWNAHDGLAVARTFTHDGSYEDPTTGGPIAATAVAGVVERLCAAFPDLTFERGEPVGTGSRKAVEWTLRGHNHGAVRDGIAPTGQAMAITGVDIFELDGLGIRSVRVHFDQKTFAESFGLMTLVQPIEQGRAKYGYSMRVAAGNRRPPGVIALTWIQGANEQEKERIRAHSRLNVQDFLAEPGFISIVTGFTGLRGFTVTAWDDEASLKRAMSKHHAIAMRELFGENFVASVWTSVWQPTRINRIWVRCPACASLEDVSDDHRDCHQCHATLPERPEFW